MPVITICGKYGSHVQQIAEGVASRLRAPLVGEDLSSLVAERLRVPADQVKELQAVPHRFWERMMYELSRALEWTGTGVFMGSGMLVGAYIPSTRRPISDFELRKALEEVVEEVAAGGNAVLVGSVPQIVLKNHPLAYHVFLKAPLGVRVRNVAEQELLDKAGARKHFEDEDDLNQAFVKRFFRQDVQDEGLYDLVLNTGKTSTEKAIKTILDLAFDSLDWQEKLHSEPLTPEPNSGDERWRYGA